MPQRLQVVAYMQAVQLLLHLLLQVVQQRLYMFCCYCKRCGWVGTEVEGQPDEQEEACVQGMHRTATAAV
jgi:hypothetical protein